MSEDVRHLALAVALAARGAPTVRPNPAVGCVLVRDGEVVGRGWHERAGGPHAEVVALVEAGAAARGATAYVTLEPCDHTGRTGPCSVALLDAGVTRVVAARRDPVPGHGGGLERLRRAGIAVDVLDLGGWQDAVTHRWLRRVATGRPWLTCKLAVDRRGSTVPSEGRWITGDVARREVHAQRDAHDAVLVGVGTVLADDPRLDVRHVPPTGPQPRPVVLDSHARTPVDATVVGRGALVLVTDVADVARIDALRVAGAEVVRVGTGGGTGPSTAGGGAAPRRVDLRAAMTTLAERGLAEVYAEPGTTLATALVEARLVDEFVVHRGGRTADLRGATDDGSSVAWPAAWRAGSWRVVRSRPLGPDREVVGRPV